MIMIIEFFVLFFNKFQGLRLLKKDDIIIKAQVCNKIDKQVPQINKFISAYLVHNQIMLQPRQAQRLSQNQFQQRLNEIVKVIKQKQEINLEIIEYLQITLIKSDEFSQMIFLQDQISKHKSFLDKILLKNNQLQPSIQKIQNFYQFNISLNQIEKALLRRVSARIIELFQSYNQKVEKYPAFEKQISNHYKLIKPKFIKEITQIDKTPSTMSSISQLCNSFFTYLQNKFNDQTKKINLIMQTIENGEIHLIEKAFVCEHCKSLQNTVTVQAQNSQKFESDKTIEFKPSQQSSQQTYFQKEKERINQKLRIMRQQAKNRQAIKKKKMKFATKHYSLYQHAMDIHKGFFFDEFTHIDENEQKSKLLIEMQQRNKHNVSFIYSFIQQCTVKNMQEKIQSMKQLLHSKNSFTQEIKNEEVKSEKSYKEEKRSKSHHSPDPIIEKVSPEPKRIEIVNECKIPQPIIYPEISCQGEERNETKSFRITNPSKKNSIPTPKSNPNLFSIKQFNQSGGQCFNFVKINMRNAPIHRARLPDISNRIFSQQERQKSAKKMDKFDSNMSSNNNLLIIKTTLTKVKVEGKKVDKKKDNEGNKIESVIAKLDKNNNHKMDKMDRRLMAESISPITINQLTTVGSIGTIAKSKKMKRSDSGNKVLVQNNDKASCKTLQINYSTNLNKKIKNFFQTVAITQNPH